MPLSSLSLAVVGVQYPNKRGPSRRFVVETCSPGDPIQLRREPSNPRDEYAVAVFNADGVQMGYLTAERAPWIGGMLQKGREVAAVFQGPSPRGALIRVAFDGSTPILPRRTDSLERGEEQFQQDDGFE